MSGNFEIRILLRSENLPNRLKRSKFFYVETLRLLRDICSTVTSWRWLRLCIYMCGRPLVPNAPKSEKVGNRNIYKTTVYQPTSVGSSDTEVWKFRSSLDHSTTHLTTKNIYNSTVYKLTSVGFRFTEVWALTKSPNSEICWILPVKPGIRKYILNN